MKIEAIGRSGRRTKANGASSARAIDTPQTLQIPGADASSRWSRFADATRSVRWRLMSRQDFHSTRACRIRQGRTLRFAAVLRLVTLCFNSLPLAASSRGRLVRWPLPRP
ncbi:hypothetical protein JFN94_16640 [Burkholderia anthina]|uniref:Uncharacterized protein n=1 Tax=Burkholderia anthina TaxID=179879 RepID=A0A7T7ALF9_9BURK|nr:MULTISPECIES: hypothetical protein [Burkholderia]MBY4867067.1 hypothetical protein [Burkholderia anthina]QQK06858.1 hypothetical protein JFN94_16640 [Burkholderia anthina]